MNNFTRITVALALATLSGAAISQSITEDIKLTASDAASQDQYGYAVATDRGITAVGAINDQDEGFGSGSVYLYDSDPDSPTYGTELGKFYAGDAAQGDQFGISLAIENGVLAVGSRWNNNDARHDSGAVYLFDVDPSSASFGSQLTKLIAVNAPGHELFGGSVAIDHGLVAVGAQQGDDGVLRSGVVYLFDADPASLSFGDELMKLSSTDAEGFDYFGISVAMNQELLVVGAYGDSDGGTFSGSAYLFDADRASPSFGAQLKKIAANNASRSDQFGWSVSIDQEVVAVGATGVDTEHPSSGAVFLFDAMPESPMFGTQLSKLISDDPAEVGGFGQSVAINNGVAAVGAYTDNQQRVDPGAVYLFVADPSSSDIGTKLSKLSASDATDLDAFGGAVSIDQGVLAIGARWNDDGGDESGSAYVFDLDCPADLNRDFALDFFDISAFLNLFAKDDLSIDFDGNGVVDFFDVSEFLEDFASGCPIAN